MTNHYRAFLKRTIYPPLLLAYTVIFIVLIVSSCKKKYDAKSSATTITAFSFVGFPDALPTITDPNITITLPAGTDLTALVANFTTTGASVKVGGVLQVSGTTANDFTQPLTYTVTAQDGTTRNYTITIVLLPNITTFSFVNPNVSGTISGTNISVVLPAGTDLTKLVANFTTTGASVKVGGVLQVSGTTANNFTQPLTYTVTAQDGTTRNYTITIVLLPNITTFSFVNPNVSGTISGTNISVVLPAGTDLTKLVANFTTTGASVKVGGVLQVSGTTANNFTHALTYTVTAQDNETQTYTIAIYATIPDANFRSFLKTVVPTDAFDGADNLNIYHKTIPTITLINCGTKGIADLTGIEYFVGLTQLYCYSNNLTSLDISKNVALTELYCSSNKIQYFDLSKNAALTELDCSSNGLGSLDVSKNTNLENLLCESNSLTSLNLSKNTNLGILNCDFNSLTSLDLSKNIALYFLTCVSNPLTTLDVSKNTALKIFYCYSNRLTSLDISSQTGWSTLFIYDNNTGENPLTTLKVNDAPAAKNHDQVKQAKTNKPSCVISTYTNNSTENPVSADYTPN